MVDEPPGRICPLPPTTEEDEPYTDETGPVFEISLFRERESEPPPKTAISLTFGNDDETDEGNEPKSRQAQDHERRRSRVRVDETVSAEVDCRRCRRCSACRFAAALTAAAAAAAAVSKFVHKVFTFSRGTPRHPRAQSHPRQSTDKEASVSALLKLRLRRKSSVHLEHRSLKMPRHSPPDLHQFRRQP